MKNNIYLNATIQIIQMKEIFKILMILFMQADKIFVVTKQKNLLICKSYQLLIYCIFTSNRCLYKQTRYLYKQITICVFKPANYTCAFGSIYYIMEKTLQGASLPSTQI